MLSTSSKIALTQKMVFPLGRKSVCTSRTRQIEKYLFTIRKSCFNLKKSMKKLKKLVSTSRNMGSSLKIDFSLISIIVSIGRKSLRIKQYCFQQRRRSFPTAGLKHWLRNLSQLKEKLFLLVRKWKKMVSTSQQISFHQLKLWSFFKNWLPRFSVMVSTKRINSEQKKTVPAKQKIRFHQLE